jgi:serine/threonine protein kinase
MSLAAGTRLGPYEVVSSIDDATAGEVYRARDTRLGRDVAIRILPAGISETPGGRNRLGEAINKIAQLNHPNICGILDSGEQDGVCFLVMERVDGESLDARLRSGPLPWRTALTIAVQIAGALDAAHRHGIVHRSLEPANIVVAGSAVRLLDFAITTLAAPVDEDEKVTGEHSVDGTANYRAPEQFDGREVDSRADIFAVGAVLYEMLAGRQAFDGQSAAAVKTAIMTAKPASIREIANDAAPIPPALNHIVLRALAKRREDRWQTARDLQYELQWLLDSSARRTAAAASAIWPRRLAWMVLGTAVFLALGAVIGRAAWLQYASHLPVRSFTFNLPPPDGTQFQSDPASFAVSPDGRKIAFVAIENGRSRLWWRKLIDADANPIPDTENASAPFWSPDSESIGFLATLEATIKRVSISGGQALRVSVLSSPAEPDLTACWLPSGSIIFNQSEGLFRVPAAGGAAELVVAQPSSAPSPLGAGSFIYLVHAAGELTREGRIENGGHAPKPVPPVHSNVVLAGGYLIFRQDDALVAQKFDEGTLAVGGSPVVLATHVAYDSSTALTAFAASDDVLAYRRPEPGAGITVVINWSARFR